jgi:hypothetical protein
MSRFCAETFPGAPHIGRYWDKMHFDCLLNFFKCFLLFSVKDLKFLLERYGWCCLLSAASYLERGNWVSGIHMIPCVYVGAVA